MDRLDNDWVFPHLDYRSRLLSVAPITEKFTVDGFFKDVPPRFFQIWFSFLRPVDENPNKWEAYCKTHGYRYTLYTEHSDYSEIEEDMCRDNLWNLFQDALHTFQVLRASDILRMSLLKKYGGIYIDCDFKCDWTGPVYEYLRMNGISFILERIGRNVGQDNAIFVCNSFVASPPNHPIVNRVVRSLPGNIEAFEKHNNKECWVVTGPMLVNRCLYGSYNILPFESFKWNHFDLHMKMNG